jgi:hypothetical protein
VGRLRWTAGGTSAGTSTSKTTSTGTATKAGTATEAGCTTATEHIREAYASDSSTESTAEAGSADTTRGGEETCIRPACREEEASQAECSVYRRYHNASVSGRSEEGATQAAAEEVICYS